MPVSSDPPCHPEACAIQTCLMNKGYQEERCVAHILKLYECCATLYQQRGDGAEGGPSCPNPTVLRRKLEQMKGAAGKQ
ncbi:SPOSA6832_00178 [Sporobolomyces salmonicolor]|uniref:Cx9C motif-containing protein 4, mitochondrial n=1 Tax=Sporidiobolus salmonicolor TaxID=5005 RepID=A0A0D6EFR0_SPOSA|nr:SPOSA6832_00178 [Sporobolomyces salmonicolor]